MNQFQLHSQTLTLLPDGAVFLPDHQTLVVADVHLGKSAAFRARGLPIPEGDTARDLQRLRNLVKKTGASRLVVAGDLFHAPAGMTAALADEMAAFLRDLAIPFHLVGGNHDAKLKRLPCSIIASAMHELGEIRILHDPMQAMPDRLHLCGHWHPVIKIRDGRRTALRLPCFLLRGNTLVLPSFGSFTGGAIISREKNDRVFVAIRDHVIELPGEAGG